MNRKVRLLTERSLEREMVSAPVADRAARAVRSVTVNAAESPLGWLFSRGHVSQRQYDAGERLRTDWERAHLAPRVTMAWNAAPVSRSRSGSAPPVDLSGAQIDARGRFDGAIHYPGPGLADILWRVVCAGEGMRDAEPRWAGQRAPGSSCSASRSIGSPIITAYLERVESRRLLQDPSRPLLPRMTSSPSASAWIRGRDGPNRLHSPR